VAGESGGHLGCAWRACVTPLGLGALEGKQMCKRIIIISFRKCDVSRFSKNAELEMCA